MRATAPFPMDHATLSALLREHGDAVYILDVDGYARNIEAMRSLFNAHYRRTGIGHSYKTNYIPQLCHVAYRSGAYAEVVSRMEYDLAIRLGASPERIILNGPVKDDALLGEALHAGAIVNVDSVEESQRALAIVQAAPDKRFALGLRLNFAMPGLRRSRFGIDVDGPDLPEVLRALSATPNCELAGIHCHMGGDRSAQAYGHRTQRMIDLARSIFPDAPPRYIDIGGGFAGSMPAELAAQLPYDVPDMKDYAAAVAGTFARAFDATNGPELIVEPGMGLLSDVLHFVCAVASVKMIAGEHHAITTGSIYNVKPTLNKFDLPLHVVPGGGSAAEEATWTISGYTCMEIDILHGGYKGRIGQGDLLVFSNVGAYTVVLKPPFIKPAPAIVALGSDGTFGLIKRPESLDNIMSTYIW